jgi:hypothetical protein
MTEDNAAVPLFDACKMLDLPYPRTQYLCRTRKLLTRTIRGRKFIERASLERYREYLDAVRAAQAHLIVGDAPR